MRRHQARAVVAVSRLILEVAAGMVGLALQELGRQEVVQLDEERTDSTGQDNDA